MPSSREKKAKALARSVLRRAVGIWLRDVSKSRFNFVIAPDGEVYVTYPEGIDRFPGAISFTYNPIRAVEELVADCEKEFDNFTITERDVKGDRLIGVSSLADGLVSPTTRNSLIRKMALAGTLRLLTNLERNVIDALGMNYEISREVAVGVLAESVTHEGELEGFAPVNMSRRVAGLASAAGDRVRQQLISALNSLPNVQFKGKSGRPARITWPRVIDAYRVLGPKRFTQENVAEQLNVHPRKVAGWLERIKSEIPGINDWHDLQKFLAKRKKGRK